jgi:hypothetical protein
MYIFLQLPDVAAFDNFHNALVTGYSYAQAINIIIPVTELITTICVIFLAYEGYYLTLKIINWIIRKIPTIS